MTEKVARLGMGKLVGILTEPPVSRATRRLPVVILLNAGSVHRVGPNRVHVKLARGLAPLGFCVLRFDFSGIGDSRRRDDNMPCEAGSVCETQQAMDYIESTRGIHQFILAGICSGANTAVKTACGDPRVVGVASINGTLLDSLQAHHLGDRLEAGVRRRYYRKYLFDRHRWRKLLAGRTDLGSASRLIAGRMKSLLHPRRPGPVQTDLSGECRRLLDRGVRLLLVYSEGSSAWDAFHLTLEAGLGPWMPSDRLRVERLIDVDHVFTLLWSQEFLVRLVCRWAGDGWPGDSTPMARGDEASGRLGSQ